MPPRLTITVLGSGTSHGIPMIACDCPVCTSPDPRDKRTRASVAIRIDETTDRDDAAPRAELAERTNELFGQGRGLFGAPTILIDTSPELRLQCLANGIRRVDAVLYTHHHIDHIAGLDDLRHFTDFHKSIIPCFGQTATTVRLRAVFAYAFEEDPDYPSTKPHLTLHEVSGSFELPLETSPPRRPMSGAADKRLPNKQVESAIRNPIPARRDSIRITPIPLLHGHLPILGFRIGDFAYCTDASEIPAGSWRLLEGLDVLVLNALRRRRHPTHFNLEQAVEHAVRIAAKRTYFTHIAHELFHETTNRGLPEGMALAHDGLVIRST
jgi:phosphoribosyl 1,2-cyclic phosphate phosphodiesterase